MARELRHKTKNENTKDLLFNRLIRLPDEVLKFERDLISTALAKANRRVTYAAKLLGIRYQPGIHHRIETSRLTQRAYSCVPSLSERVGHMSTVDFPKRIPEKLKTIREHLGLTPDEIAPIVGARTGAEILAYENDEDDLLVTVLWNYSKLAGCPIDQILYDNLEITFRDLQVV